MMISVLCNGYRVPRLICTRHPGFLALLYDIDPTLREVEIMENAKEEDVRGKHIFGQAPLHIACFAYAQTIIPLDLPRELRGVECTIEQLRMYSGAPQTYVIRSLETVSKMTYDYNYLYDWAMGSPVPPSVPVGSVDHICLES